MMTIKKEWHLSPAYDRSAFNGEHATTINGESKNPDLDDILAVVYMYKSIQLGRFLAYAI